MKRLPIYQIDAFSSQVFSGNPAAVCPLEKWIEDSLMQAIAQENNLSETAFFVPEGNGYHIRWFTPIAPLRHTGLINWARKIFMPTRSPSGVGKYFAKTVVIFVVF